MKSDAQLQKDVIDELDWDPSVSHANIGVAAKNGIVTLTGSVPTYIEKYAAERAAQRVSGVTGVVEKIDVRLMKESSQGDEDLAAAAVLSLKWHVQVPEESIKVKVENGRIEITGHVEWEFQKGAATDAVKNLSGVTQVINNINVKARVDPINVKEKIEQALKRAAEKEAQDIHVDVQGRKVILSGKVRSLAQLGAAKTAAWNAPGVIQVENLLKIAA